MSILTGDRYLDCLVRFVERSKGQLLDGTLTLKLNPIGLHYVQSRLEALREIESLLSVAPVDYLRSYVSDLGDHRALEQLRRILRLLTCLKVVSGFEKGKRDPAPLSLLPFGRLKVLELRGCDLSTTEAKGLLELRHTLERLICHNSTDALRHIFASRIVDVKDSPTWNKLSFVSCACNNLVLMDESLQLLPAVETLDLSRNRFTKVDNLKKCVKLKHLDLGFNQLRSITMLGEISSRIVKLNLRNNAVASLRGLEYMKSLVGLDLSYNLISSFSELEILSSLSSLESLWLEGNPICCARWYGAHVFSFFPDPDKLKLDEKNITTREHWERHVIFAKRQKKPTGYGFYFPAKDEPEEDSTKINNRKRNLRVAAIEEEGMRLSEEDSTDQEPLLSSEIESSLRKDENAPISDSESKVIDLINKAENMKKERSVLWLKEFNEWMDQHQVQINNNKKENSSSNEKAKKLLGESSTVSEISLSSDISFNEEAHHNSSLNAENTAINGVLDSKSKPNLTLFPPKYKEEVLHKRLFSDEILELSTGSSDNCGSSSDEDVSCELYATSSDDEVAQRDINGHVNTLHRKVKRIVPLDEDQNGIMHIERDFCENTGKMVVDAYGECSCSSWEEDDDDILDDKEEYEKVLGFFEENIVYFDESERYQDLIFSDCMFQNESEFIQRKVAVLQSSENKLYILLIEDVTPDSQESIPKILGIYRLEEVKKIVIGLGLQALRLQMADESVYIFLPRTIEKAYELLSLLKISTIPPLNNNLSLESWENIQVELLGKEISCDFKMGISFYSPLLFYKDTPQGGSWQTRSMFLIDGSVFVCIEDYNHFGSFDDDVASRTYFSLDSHCSIENILELVIDLRHNKCMTMITENKCDEEHSTSKNQIEESIVIQQWRLQWFSQDVLLKFVSLLKATHLEIAASPLSVHCTS